MSFPTETCVFFKNITDKDAYWKNRKDSTKYARNCLPVMEKTRWSTLIREDTRDKCSVQKKYVKCSTTPNIWDAKENRCYQLPTVCLDCTVNGLPCNDIQEQACRDKSDTSRCRYCRDASDKSTALGSLCRRKYCNLGETRDEYGGSEVCFGNCDSPYVLKSQVTGNSSDRNTCTATRSTACRPAMIANGYCGVWAGDQERKLGYYAICPSNMEYKDFDEMGYYNCRDCNSCGNGNGGVKYIATYDPSVFDALGGIGTNKIIKSVEIVRIAAKQADTDEYVFNNFQNNLFKATVDIRMIDGLQTLTLLKKLVEESEPFKKANEYKFCKNYNDVAINLCRCYLYMKVPIGLSFQTEASNPKSWIIGTCPLFFNVSPTSNKAEDIFSLNSAKRNSAGIRETTDFYCAKDNMEDGLVLYTTRTFDPDVPRLGITTTPKVMLVEPVILYDKWNRSKFDATNVYEKIDPEISEEGVFMVIHDLTNIVDVARYGRNRIDSFIETMLNVAIPAKYLEWNRYVYINWILPLFCYNRVGSGETSSCPSIADYSSIDYAQAVDRVSVVKPNTCSYLQADNDCNKYLMRLPNTDQPTANRTRTNSNLDAWGQKFCADNPTLLECQCLQRDRIGSPYYSYFTTGNGLQIQSRNAAGCWYVPCSGSGQDNIIVPSVFRSENRQCSNICSNVISVTDTLRNVNLDTISLVNSCIVRQTLPPTLPPTSAPVPPTSAPPPINQTYMPLADNPFDGTIRPLSDNIHDNKHDDEPSEEKKRGVAVWWMIPIILIGVMILGLIAWKRLRP